MISASDALDRLRQGNQRFISESRDLSNVADKERRDELASGQKPFAVILGCADSRVPPELVFDQGLGDLFVIRVAGNIATPSQVGSVEFAAAVLGSRLVVVLGHSQCGAISATLNEIEKSSGDLSPALGSLVDEIRPAVEPLLGGEANPDRQSLMKDAIRANVRATAHQLRHSSAVLEEQAQSNGLRIVGAEYSLETGVVDFFDGLEEL